MKSSMTFVIACIQKRSMTCVHNVDSRVRPGDTQIRRSQSRRDKKKCGRDKECAHIKKQKSTQFRCPYGRDTFSASFALISLTWAVESPSPCPPPAASPPGTPTVDEEPSSNDTGSDRSRMICIPARPKENN